MLKPRLAVIASLIFAAAASRLIPHPPNFTALSATALFAGAYLSDWRVALAVPLSALLLSDALLGFYHHIEIVYGSFALIVGIGVLLRPRKTAFRIGGAALLSAVVFFVLTNLGVWATGELYPKNMSGLIASYVAALPFFHNMIIGDAFYVLALFGSLALLERLIPRLRETPALPQPA